MAFKIARQSATYKDVPIWLQLQHLRSVLFGCGLLVGVGI